MLNTDLFNDSDKILLAVSGGVDSMVMLSLFHSLGHTKLSIAHVNYGLRDKESDLDELLVKTTSQSYGIQAYFLKADIDRLVSSKGLSIQEAARDIRYNWFEQLSEEHGFNKIATAHHTEDQTETILFNLIRGAGIHGLTGMSSTNKKIIRPLLNASKKDIVKYARVHHINYREDNSNQENKYTRNKIRNLIFPSLIDINPKASEHINHTGNILKKYSELVQYFLENNKENWMTTTKALIEIRLEAIPLSHLEVILYELIKHTKINHSQILDITEAFSNNRTGAQFATATHRLVLDRGNLLISSLKQIGNFEMFVKLGDNFDEESGILLQIESTDFPKTWPSKESICYLSKSRLKFPLIMRTWQAGDRIAPLGMSGKTKKIQDILTDKKVNKFEKQSALVLIHNSEICWLVGYTVSEKFKAKKGAEVVKFSFNKK